MHNQTLHRWSSLKLWVATVAIGCATAVPALSQASFNGTYTGQLEVTRGVGNPSCASNGPMSITVKDGTFIYIYGIVTSKVSVAPDGSFEHSEMKGGGRSGAAQLITRGRISNGSLNADFVAGANCAYHWSLKKT